MSRPGKTEFRDSPAHRSVHSRWRSAAVAVVLALGIVAAASVLDNPKSHYAPFLVPYFSGAANFQLGEPWRYNPRDVATFESLPDSAAQAQFQFPSSPAEELETYGTLAVGYLYVVLVARHSFFWQGDLQAAESLQILAHIVVTLAVMLGFRCRLDRVVFYVLYGLNPLVLHVVTYPLYYYWQTIPTALLAAYLLDRQRRFGWFAPVVVLALAASFQIRPSVLFVCLMLLVLMIWRECRNVKKAIVLVSVFCGVWIASNQVSDHQMFHTAYIGLGAYPNPFGLNGPYDELGHQRYEHETGEVITRGPGGNFDDPETLVRYNQVLRGAYFECIRQYPWIAIRNFALNTLESFAFGYLTARPAAHYASASIGLVVIGILVWRRRWLFLVAIGLSSAAVVPLFPPIPVYMFGAYILLVSAAIDVLHDLPAYRSWAERSG